MEKRTPWISANFCRELVYRPPKNMIAEVTTGRVDTGETPVSVSVCSESAVGICHKQMPTARQLRSGVW